MQSPLTCIFSTLCVSDCVDVWIRIVSHYLTISLLQVFTKFDIKEMTMTVHGDKSTSETNTGDAESVGPSVHTGKRGMEEFKRQLEKIDRMKEKIRPDWVSKSGRDQILRRQLKKSDAKNVDNANKGEKKKRNRPNNKITDAGKYKSKKA